MASGAAPLWVLYIGSLDTKRALPTAYRDDLACLSEGLDVSSYQQLIGVSLQCVDLRQDECTPELVKL